MGAYHFRTENVAIASAAAGTTITHGLGTAPGGSTGAVLLTNRTNTGGFCVLSSTSQIVVIRAQVDATNCDVDVFAPYHSIIQ